MRKSGCILLAYLVTMLVLEGNWVRAAPEARTDQLLSALNDLEKLERKYSTMARPSVRSGPASQPDMGPKVQRAINMLRIQHLERLYGDRARPRFGKRAQINNNFPQQDYDGQLHNIPPVLRKMFQQYANLHDSVSKWRTGGLAPDPEMRPYRTYTSPDYSQQPEPIVDNQIDFV